MRHTAPIAGWCGAASSPALPNEICRFTPYNPALWASGSAVRQLRERSATDPVHSSPRSAKERARVPGDAEKSAQNSTHQPLRVGL